MLIDRDRRAEVSWRKFLGVGIYAKRSAARKILMASVEVGQECGMPRVLRIFELGRTRTHDA